MVHGATGGFESSAPVYERARPTYPGAAVRRLAAALPVRSASVDAVIVAQAFHWFDGSRALAEIHRVLRPGDLPERFPAPYDTDLHWCRARPV